MKKLICMLLALGMVLAMAACGGNKAQQQDPTTVPATTPTTQATEAPTEATQAPTEDAESAAVAELFGTVEGSVYTNTYLGLSFDAGQDMRLLPEEEIQQIYGAATQLLSKEQAEFAEGAMMMDMLAINGTTGENAILQIINNSLVAIAYNVQKTAFLNGMISGSIQSTEKMGCTDVKGEILEGTFCGKPCDVVLVTGKIIGMDYIQKMFVYSNGSYVICVAFTGFSEEAVEALVARFQAI